METVQVKYHGALALDAFACAEIQEASDVFRICYDAAERYMIIQFQSTYYHCCLIDAATMRGLQTAVSERQILEGRFAARGVTEPSIVERTRNPGSIESKLKADFADES